MKNLYSKSEFLSISKIDGEMTNEGIFQALGKLFSKAKAYISKIKGGKEIDAI